MRGLSSLPRPFLITLATLFAAIVTLYSAIWMYYIRWRPAVELGINAEYSFITHSLEISNVLRDSPAQGAGLRPGDRIVAINGWRLTSSKSFDDTWGKARPGDKVELTVERRGTATPFAATAVFRSPTTASPAETPTQYLALQIIEVYPVLFLVVGLLVLFWRLEDRNAWLLAVLFACFIAVAPLLQIEGSITPSLRAFAVAYKTIFFGLFPAFFYYFFAVFPVASPFDQRLPWLKSALFVGAAAVALPLGIWVLLTGSSEPLTKLASWAGKLARLSVIWGYLLAVPALGLVSLVWNSIAAPTVEARRKTRVIVWGMVAGVTPYILLQGSASYINKPMVAFPFWVWAPAVLFVFLVPLAFAYAIVKHRVMEIPVLLRRSARYVLVQRGFIVLLFLVAASAIALFTHTFSRFFQTDSSIGMALSAVFGIVLVWASAPLVIGLSN